MESIRSMFGSNKKDDEPPDKLKTWVYNLDAKDEVAKQILREQAQKQGASQIKILYEWLKDGMDEKDTVDDMIKLAKKEYNLNNKIAALGKLIRDIAKKYDLEVPNQDTNENKNETSQNGEIKLKKQFLNKIAEEADFSKLEPSQFSMDIGDGMKLDFKNPRVQDQDSSLLKEVFESDRMTPDQKVKTAKEVKELQQPSAREKWKELIEDVKELNKLKTEESNGGEEKEETSTPEYEEVNLDKEESYHETQNNSSEKQEMKHFKKELDEIDIGNRSLKEALNEVSEKTGENIRDMSKEKIKQELKNLETKESEEEPEEKQEEEEKTEEED